MKRFFFLLSLFVVEIVAVDQAFGLLMHHLVDGAASGHIGRDNYISNICADDVLVFGSSRGQGNYNTEMMTDSLGLRCFNCAEDGCGSVLAYARLRMIEERKRPKLIIYDVFPETDYFNFFGDSFTAPFLKVHYDRPGVDSLLWMMDSTERIKMLSGIHRYKAQCKSFKDCVSSRNNADTLCGFVPIDLDFDTLKIHKDIDLYYDRAGGYVYDDVKLSCLKRFVERTRDVNVIFVVSPIWYGMDTAALDTIKQICADNGRKLIDFSNDGKYVHNNDYFKDGCHLNARGADEFTRDFIRRLRAEGVLEDQPGDSLR